MAAGASSGRMLGAAAAVTNAFHAEGHHTPSTLPSHSGRPCPPRIPSLKFPYFLPESSSTSNTTTRNGRTRRAAEQKAALIAQLGAAATAIPCTTEEKRRDGHRLLPERRQAGSVDLLLLPLAYEVTRRLVLRQFGATWLALTRRCSAKFAEAFIHQVIVRCQSFTLIGVAGSLVGSLPCFLEGCGVVLESFFLQFRAMSQVVDQAETIKLLIEALDMFLVGTALLTFGMGMYGMTYGGSSSPSAGRPAYEKLKAGASIRSVAQAKSRFGHAVLLLLQAGALDKFRSVPLVTGLDMACFAGAVLASSAGVFLLSKLAVHPRRRKPAFA